MKKFLAGVGIVLIVALVGLGYYLLTSNKNLVATNPSNNLAAAAAPTNGLIGYWPFDGNGTDSSGNNETAVLGGSPVPTFTTGEIGQAIVFNGSNYADVPSSAAFSNLIGAPLSISMWVNYSNASNGRQVMVTLPDNDTRSGNNAVDIELPGSNTIAVRAWGGATIISATAPSANVWHNIIYTQSASVTALYVDGTLVGSGTLSGQVGTPASLNFGFFSSAWGDFYTGSLDDVRLYNRALSATEASTIYQAATASTGSGGTTPPPSAVTSWFEVTNSAGTAGSNGIVGATITISGGNLTNNLVLTTGSTASISTTALTVGQTYTVTTSASGYASQTSTLTVSSSPPVDVIALSVPKTVTTWFEIVNSTKPAGSNGIVGATITLSAGNLTAPLTLTTGSTASISTTKLTLGQTYNAIATALGYTPLSTTAGINTAGEVVQWPLAPIAIEWPNQLNVQVESTNNFPIPNAVISIAATNPAQAGSPATSLAANSTGVASAQVQTSSCKAFTLNGAAETCYTPMTVGNVVTITVSAVGFGSVSKTVTLAAGVTNVMINVPPTLSAPTTKTLVLFMPGAAGSGFADMQNYFLSQGVVTSVSTYSTATGWQDLPAKAGTADLATFEFAPISQSILTSASQLNNALQAISNISSYKNIYIVTHSISHVIVRTAVLAAYGTACPSTIAGPANTPSANTALQAIYKKATILSINPILGGGILPAGIDWFESGNQYIADESPASSYQTCLFGPTDVAAFNSAVKNYYAFTIGGVPGYNDVANNVPVPVVSNADIAFTAICETLSGGLPNPLCVPPLTPIPPIPPPPLFSLTQGDDSSINVWNYLAVTSGYTCPALPAPFNTVNVNSILPPGVTLTNTNDTAWAALYQNGKPTNPAHYVSYYFGCKLDGESNVPLNPGSFILGGLNNVVVHTMLLEYQPLYQTLGTIIF